MDSHAEDNKGRGENESKISEQLERRTSLAIGQDGSGPWGYNGSKRTNTVVNHTCNAVQVQRESRLIRNHFPLTLQFIGSVASKPANIAMIAMRAVRRQPEYSFAPARDQVARQGCGGGAGLTHIVQRYFRFPVMTCHSNQRVVKYSHLPESARRTRRRRIAAHM